MPPARDGELGGAAARDPDRDPRGVRSDGVQLRGFGAALGALLGRSLGPVGFGARRGASSLQLGGFEVEGFPRARRSLAREPGARLVLPARPRRRRRRAPPPRSRRRPRRRARRGARARALLRGVRVPEDAGRRSPAGSASPRGTAARSARHSPWSPPAPSPPPRTAARAPPPRGAPRREPRAGALAHASAGSAETSTLVAPVPRRGSTSDAPECAAPDAADAPATTERVFPASAPASEPSPLDSGREGARRRTRGGPARATSTDREGELGAATERISSSRGPSAAKPRTRRRERDARKKAPRRRAPRIAPPSPPAARSCRVPRPPPASPPQAQAQGARAHPPRGAWCLSARTRGRTRCRATGRRRGRGA